MNEHSSDLQDLLWISDFGFLFICSQPLKVLLKYFSFLFKKKKKNRNNDFIFCPYFKHNDFRLCHFHTFALNNWPFISIKFVYSAMLTNQLLALTFSQYIFEYQNYTYSIKHYFLNTPKTIVHFNMFFIKKKYLIIPYHSQVS